MAGKGYALTSNELGYAIDSVSKNALIEILVDRAYAEIGQGELASDEELADLITIWMRPVLNARNDRLIDLRAIMAKHAKQAEDYRLKRGKYALTPQATKELGE